MRFFHLFLCAAGILALALQGRANVDFSDYEIILQRQPFGVAPVAPVAPREPAVDASLVAEALKEEIFKDLRMCALRTGDLGPRAGVVDIAGKPPKSYYLAVGQSQDGLELLEVDFLGKKAKFRKDGEEQWLEMPKIGEAITPPAGPAAAGATVVSRRARRTGEPKPGSYAERLRKRRELVRKAEPPKLQGEELREHLEEYQMELIRQGMPPLPMELTPEMDAQLVAEGVLPPAEGGEGVDGELPPGTE